MSKTNSLHYQLCCEAGKWIKNIKYGNYKYIAVELCCLTLENPDAWGTNGYNSVMIEVKTSRADFLKDKKKQFRNEQFAKYAMGNYRYYLAPTGIINIEDLPEKWGLLEWDGKKINTIKQAEEQKCENHGELAMLCSIMRREGIKSQIFNYRNL